MAWLGKGRVLGIGMMAALAGACAKEQAPSAGAPAAGKATGEGSAGSAPSDGMAMYAGQLYGCLQQVFVPPASAAAGLAAHLKLNVGAAGEVAGEHIAQSSGDAAFDSALLAAAAQCREVPPPPADVLALLQQQGLTLVFKR